MKDLKSFIQQLLKDKNGSYSLRELVIAVLLIVLVVSWIGEQFFGKQVPESVFHLRLLDRRRHIRVQF